MAEYQGLASTLANKDKIKAKGKTELLDTSFWRSKSSGMIARRATTPKYWRDTASKLTSLRLTSHNKKHEINSRMTSPSHKEDTILSSHLKKRMVAAALKTCF